jgi:hypothetical protein
VLHCRFRECIVEIDVSSIEVSVENRESKLMSVYSQMPVKRSVEKGGVGTVVGFIKRIVELMVVHVAN